MINSGSYTFTHLAQAFPTVNSGSHEIRQVVGSACAVIQVFTDGDHDSGHPATAGRQVREVLIVRHCPIGTKCVDPESRKFPIPNTLVI